MTTIDMSKSEAIFMAKVANSNIGCESSIKVILMDSKTKRYGYATLAEVQDAGDDIVYKLVGEVDMDGIFTEYKFK